jgi:tRNA1(Val) A37 N6-methylase TrmN6
VYTSFLEVIDRSGKILELGCGNGLLLKFLVERSGRTLKPYGIEADARRVEEARRSIFPQWPGSVREGDLKTCAYRGGPFDLIIANPLYANPGYDEQVGGKIRRLDPDGSIDAFVKRCHERLGRRGRLVLFCYAGQLKEIEPFREILDRGLSSIPFRTIPSKNGAVTFFVADRS